MGPKAPHLKTVSPITNLSIIINAINTKMHMNFELFHITWSSGRLDKRTGRPGDPKVRWPELHAASWRHWATPAKKKFQPKNVYIRCPRPFLWCLIFFFRLTICLPCLNRYFPCEQFMLYSVLEGGYAQYFRLLLSEQIQIGMCLMMFLQPLHFFSSTTALRSYPPPTAAFSATGRHRLKNRLSPLVLG